MKCEFIAGAANLEQIPPSALPEVAFIGRSNVGKSSLINAIVNERIARTSSNPGCTQQINFFILHPHNIVLVDLPGYGYAKASKKEVAGWNKMMISYLKQRASLKRAYLLIDSRHDIKESDWQMMKILDETAVSYQIVLTKIDKTSKNQVETLINAVQLSSLKHTALHPNIIITSTVDKTGIDQMREELLQFKGD